MNSKHLITVMAAAIFAPATQALAEQTARQDSSQYLVWAFLGMCALIVIVQLMPVVMIAYGLVKGLLQGKKVPAAAEVTADK